MKQDIEERIPRILDALEQSVVHGAQWAGTEAAILAQEIVTYGRWYHAFWAAACLLAVLVVLWMFRRFLVWLAGDQEGWDAEDKFPLAVVVFGFGGTSLLVLCIVGFVHSSAAMKAWLAPRLYIIEYVSNLLN